MDQVSVSLLQELGWPTFLALTAGMFFYKIVWPYFLQQQSELKEVQAKMLEIVQESHDQNIETYKTVTNQFLSTLREHDQGFQAELHRMNANIEKLAVAIDKIGKAQGGTRGKM